MRAISRRNRGKEVKKSFEHFLFLTVPLLAKESWASGKMNSVCECNIKKPSFLRPIERVHFFIPFDPQLRADTYNSIQLSLSRRSLLNGVNLLCGQRSCRTKVKMETHFKKILWKIFYFSSFHYWSSGGEVYYIVGAKKWPLAKTQSYIRWSVANNLHEPIFYQILLYYVLKFL